MGDPENTPGTSPQQSEDKTAAQPSQESFLGKDWLGLFGTLLLMAYLMLFAAGDLYVLVKVWPPAPAPTQPSTQATPTPTPAPSPSPTRTALVLAAAPSPTPSPSTAGADQKGAAKSPSPTPTPAAGQEQKPWKVDFLWGKYEFNTNSALFLIVMLCGAMGALLHALSSFYSYTGSGQLRRRWSAMYVLLPFNGALLATVFYLIVRGGFMPQSVGNTTTFGFAALGALVGLFSQQATLKLKQVAETVFTKVPPGKDPVPAPAPKISKIVPQHGTTGNTVTISGTNFISGLKVKFGQASAASVEVHGSTVVTVVAPQNAPGQVDVEVINPDNQNDVSHNAFKYD